MREKNRFPGQSMVEFALIFPIVLVLVLGFLDLGRALFYYSSLSNAVREGTRSGIVKPYDKDAIQAKVLEYAFGLTTTTIPLIEENIEPDYTVKDGYYETLEITATFCFVPVTPFIEEIIGTKCEGEDAPKGIELTARSVMRYEPGIEK